MKNVHVRELSDDDYTELRRRALAAGVGSVPEYVRSLIARDLARPTVAQWLERYVTPRLAGPSPVTADAVREALDELRGPWPAA